MHDDSSEEKVVAHDEDYPSTYLTADFIDYADYADNYNRWFDAAAMEVTS